MNACEDYPSVTGETFGDGGFSIRVRSDRIAPT
jgi:hypothetical protein